MTREDIIRMAREAGIDWHRHWNDDESNRLEAFAELVRADGRERLLQAVEEMRPVQDNPLLQNKPPEFWIRSFKQAIEARGNT
jgi:MoaA/NifB/PqqE/SkfB family radical SAM enzyme